MNVFKVSTTAYEEEDFYLLTSLTSEQVISVIEPIVMAERDNDIGYDNETLVNALKKSYPKERIAMYTNFDTITI